MWTRRRPWAGSARLCRKSLAEPLCHHAPRLSRDSLEDEDELVAADAGNLVSRSVECPEETRELDEDGIARRVRRRGQIERRAPKTEGRHPPSSVPLRLA